ncbi:alpha/beta hydrolase [Microvirga sp. BSC39]|uniref:alpha/beta hydrolase n=1 Tax=Microvirga sp. BSC39 TaxID=1549810 RepID=UPI0004E888BC|nr:alpha/beta hydrolase [Microvirga sp. BSC39]KFG66482.1 lipase [Microvirga sp. BSC39]
MSKLSSSAAGVALASVLATGAAASPVLEAKTQTFIDALAQSGGAPIYTLTYDQARNVLAGAQSPTIPSAATTVEDTVFPVGPTGKVNVRIVRPAGATGVLPVVMYFHGGGWVMGDPNTHDHLIREISAGANAAVVFVHYDRAPEVKYPTNNEQAYAATRYVVENAKSLNLDASRLAVAGDSAGGNMAAAVTLLAKERKGPQFRHQVLFYPVTDDVSENSSYKSFGEGPWLTTKAMHYFLSANFPQGSRQEITAFPLKASVEQLKGLPEATIIVAENDLLRDEGEAYGRKLTQAGVTVTSSRYNGTIHDFVLLNALANTPAAKAAIAQASAALKAAFAH